MTMWMGGMTMWMSLRSLANAILGKVPGKPGRVDAATRMAMDADFSGKGEPAAPEPEPPGTEKAPTFPRRRR